MNAREISKIDEEQVLLWLASLPKSHKPLVQSMLARMSTLQLDEYTAKDVSKEKTEKCYC